MAKLINRSRVKFLNKEKGFNTSEEFLKDLPDAVEYVLHKARESAKKEGRKTVMQRDIPANLIPF